MPFYIRQSESYAREHLELPADSSLDSMFKQWQFKWKMYSYGDHCLEFPFKHDTKIKLIQEESLTPVFDSKWKPYHWNIWYYHYYQEKIGWWKWCIFDLKNILLLDSWCSSGAYFRTYTLWFSCNSYISHYKNWINVKIVIGCSDCISILHLLFQRQNLSGPNGPITVWHTCCLRYSAPLQ